MNQHQQFGPQPGQQPQFDQQAQFGQPAPYGQGPQPPKSKTGLWIGLAVVAIAVIVGVVLLITKPWSSSSSDGPRGPGGNPDAAPGAQYSLDYGVTATVAMPSGWTAEVLDGDGHRLLMLIPDDETRSASEIYERSGDESPGDLHAVSLVAVVCDDYMDASVGLATKSNWNPTRQRLVRMFPDEANGGDFTPAAAIRADDEHCVIASGVDFGSGGTPASDLLERIDAEGNIVTVGTDG